MLDGLMSFLAEILTDKLQYKVTPFGENTLTVKDEHYAVTYQIVVRELSNK
jgi:hypothetical protein